ncbi:sulfatase [Echinicola arenosa]|nr:sulfatase [Echinicola arenosa]
MKKLTKQKPILLHFLILGLTLILGACSKKGEGTMLAPSKPNVILINVDDLGWRDLGFMGSDYYETPNLDKLSQDGIVFTNAYAGASNCAPSRANMISGKYGPRHGVYTVSPSDRGNSKTRQLIPTKNNDTLADSLFTLGEMFHANGYTTGTFGKWHVSDDPTLMGFDVNVGGNHKGNPGKGGYFSPYNVEHLEDGPEGEYLTDRLTDEAIRFVKTNQEKPFFLYLPFYTVHSPLMGKPALVEKYQSKEGLGGQDNAVYAAMVASMDENVGRLLKAVADLGLEENTIILFTSDNGGIRKTSNQYPLRAGKGSYYEGGIRVPMVIKYPNKIKAGQKVDQPVMQMDFFPTLQSIIGAEKTNPNLDGQDLSPLLFDGKSLAERDLFWHFPIYLEAYSPKDDQAKDPLFRTRPGSVIRSGKWKLHEYFEDGGLELYNLEEDLTEQHNVAEQFPEVTTALFTKLQEWRKATGAPLPTERNPAYDALFEKNQQAKVMQ